VDAQDSEGDTFRETERSAVKKRIFDPRTIQGVKNDAEKTALEAFQ
jgi:hypothetical protein